MGKNEENNSTNIDQICNKLYTNLLNINNSIIFKSETSQIEIEKERISEDDEIKLYKKGMEKPLLAQISYIKAYEIDHSLGIKLMVEYLKACIHLDPSSRLYPIRKFFNQPWSIKIFDENIEIFFNCVIPIIFQLDLLSDFEKIGIKIIVYSFEDIGGGKYLSVIIDDVHEFIRPINHEIYSEISSYLQKEPRNLNLLCRTFDKSILDLQEFKRD